MNRINTLFSTKKENILSVYFTAGHPKMDTAAFIINDLKKNGVDLIEIGIPFSDPLADGPVIQKSSQKALENGMTLKKLLSEIKDIRQSVKIPLILMGYFNTVLQFGVEEFCRQIAAIGIDGVILPDMPMEVYQESYQHIFESNGIIPVFLITPGTSEERIRKTDELSKGFIYMVSSASTTGTKSGFNEESLSYFKRIKAMNLKNPVLTGFGISNKETFAQACEFSNGAIIGSAFIKALEQSVSLEKNIQSFIQNIK